MLRTLGQLLALATVLYIASQPLFAQSIPSNITVEAKVSTGSVKGDADDPAVWIHPTDPAKSVIIGTDKASGSPGLYVWDMSGKQIQYVVVDHPNNVDIRYGVKLGDRLIDIAATNPRPIKELKVFEIDRSTGKLTDITTASGIKVSQLNTPYGCALYKRPSDGAMFAILSSKDGEAAKNLHQYRLEADGSGKVKGSYVRAFGNNTIGEVVEGIAVDDELGYIFAAEEGKAVRKYYADRDLGKDEQIVAFGTGDGFSGDREGVGIYACTDRTGYVLVSSQGNTTVKVYRREGDDGNPHKHSLVTTITTKGSSGTDGLDVTNHPTSAQFPHGFLITHNSPGKQFKLYAWEDIAKDYLTICTADRPNPTAVEERSGTSPAQFSLEQNYPNPFNPETTIRFRVLEAAHVKLTIVNVMGQTVRTLVDTMMQAGETLVRWDGHDDAGMNVPSGAYFYELSSGDQKQIRKLLLLR